MDKPTANTNALTTTGCTNGPMQSTHTSSSRRPQRRDAVASRARAAARAAASTAARHARLCRRQSRRWHSRPQYQAKWHWLQLETAPGVWQS